MLEGKDLQKDTFKRMTGDMLTMEWLETDDSALLEPIVIEDPDGLGMKMPSNDFTVDDVAELVGPDTPVEVMGASIRSYPPPVVLKMPTRCRVPIEYSWIHTREVG